MSRKIKSLFLLFCMTINFSMCLAGNEKIEVEQDSQESIQVQLEDEKVKFIRNFFFSEEEENFVKEIIEKCKKDLSFGDKLKRLLIQILIPCGMSVSGILFFTHYPKNHPTLRWYGGALSTISLILQTCPSIEIRPLDYDQKKTIIKTTNSVNLKNLEAKLTKKYKILSFKLHMIEFLENWRENNHFENETPEKLHPIFDELKKHKESEQNKKIFDVIVEEAKKEIESSLNLVS